MARSTVKVAGFSLIELMIALALGLLLSTAMIDVTLNASRSHRHLQLATEVLENGRYLTGLLTREVRLAGYYGDTAVIPNVVSARSPTCNETSSEALTAALSYPVYGFNDVSAGASICGIGGLQAGTDLLLVRRADTQTVPLGKKLHPRQHYLQSAPLAILLDSGAMASRFSLTAKDGVTAIALREFHQTHYYVDGDRNLKRRRLIRGKYGRAEPLVEGVDDFQVLYGIDRSGNGIPNAEASAPAYVSLPSSNEDWSNVVSVKLYLLLSSTAEAPGANDPKHYSYAEKTDISFDDSRKRRLFTTVISLRNPSMKRAGI